MPYEQIITETRSRVGAIRLNRPEKLNAYTPQMSAEMCDQLAKWNDDPAIGAVVLTGEGRSFCAGTDIGGFGQRLERIRGGNERADAPFVNAWVGTPVQLTSRNAMTAEDIWSRSSLRDRDGADPAGAVFYLAGRKPV
jgi:enoyl-CoA hydratase/carnithine racemase